MTITSNNGHKYAQTHIIRYDNGAMLMISYTTTVCKVDPDGWLTVNGLYSRTTIKHIGWFMKELGLSYQLAKALYIDGLQYNLHTGEVKAR